MARNAIINTLGQAAAGGMQTLIQQQMAELAFQQQVRQLMLQREMAKQMDVEQGRVLSNAFMGQAGLLGQSLTPDMTPEEAAPIKKQISQYQMLGQVSAGGLTSFKTLTEGLKDVKDVFGEKKEKQKSFGNDREAIAQEFYGVSFGELESKQQADVNRTFQQRQKEAKNPELAIRTIDAYDKDPNIRAFRELKDSMNQMFGVLKGGMDRGDFAFADQAAVVMFNKVIDPTSVVREGEFSRTTKFMRWTERLKSYAERVTRGGNLTDKERQELVDTSYDMLKSAHQVSVKRLKTFSQRGKQYGLSEADFDPVGEIAVPTKPTLPKPMNAEEFYKKQKGLSE